MQTDKYEVKCPNCGKIRYVTYHAENILCRSCAKKLKYQKEQFSIEKTCEFCGKKFIAHSNRTRYCKGPHYRTCPICGKEYLEDNVENLKRPPVACSYECRAKKTRKTSLQKYGCLAPGNNKEARKKSEKTMVEKYGVKYALQNPNIKAKAVDTIKKKHRVDNVGESERGIKKRIETHLKKYGVKGTFLLPEYRPKTISKINKEIGHRLEEWYKVEYEYRLDGKFFDIYLPEINQLIEINPTYTHNSFGNHWNENGIPSNYHLEKTKLAESHGFRCLHVFDWDNIENIVSLLLPTKSIYARQCTIYRLNLNVAKKFVSENHIQGSCRGQEFALGLVKDGELYMVMTFGKPRYNKKYSIELLRLCTKRGYRVVGGASRLFKFATEPYGFDDIISYCDRAKFNGSVYTKMGMKLAKTTPPQEIWSKDRDHITANLLRDRGFDQLFNTSFGKGTSNDLLMLQHGWLPVYDCGQLVFEYKK